MQISNILGTLDYLFTNKQGCHNDNNRRECVIKVRLERKEGAKKALIKDQAERGALHSASWFRRVHQKAYF